jgi:hypothetical protein
MKQIARLSLIGLVVATASAPAWAQPARATATQTATRSTLDEVAATNTARDYLVANHMEALRTRGINVQNLFATVATTDLGEVIVYLKGPGISAAILMSADELEVLQASVEFSNR